MELTEHLHSDDVKAASRMRKLLKSSLNTAFEAHQNAMNSKSDIAKYNSGLLRTLERAFAANPEVDILSKLPSNYNATVEKLRAEELLDAQGEILEMFYPPSPTFPSHSYYADRSDELVPPSKRLKPITDASFSPHLQSLTGPGEVNIREQVAAPVFEFFPQGCSRKNVIDALGQCEIIFRDDAGGDRMILKMGDTIVVKIVPNVAGTQEYSALKYLEKHCTGVPAPKPLGMLELNGQFLMFMSYVPGESLDKIWPSLDQKQKIAVSTKLDFIFSKLRSHKLPPAQVWGGVGGEGCIDRRRDIRQHTEDIRNPHDFEKFFFSNPKYGSGIWITFLRQLYGMAEDDSGSQDSCILTHADLRQANIIVQWEQGQEINISGIVDWEYSGFYPAYWEAIKLTNCMGPHDDSDWFLHLPAVISPQRYPKRWLLDLVWDRHVD